MENKKYELVLDDTIQLETGATLYRIRAYKDFGNVKKGELGGYIESESNLSQKGNAWVFHNARVYENACVCDNAIVFGEARIYGNAFVRDNSRIGDEAKVYGSAQVCGNGLFEGCAKIKKDKHYFIANSVGSEDGVLTAFVSEKGIEITRGCFAGTIQEFEKAVIETHGDSRVGREYQALLAFIKLKFKKRIKKHGIC